MPNCFADGNRSQQAEACDSLFSPSDCSSVLHSTHGYIIELFAISGNTPYGRCSNIGNGAQTSTGQGASKAKIPVMLRHCRHHAQRRYNSHNHVFQPDTTCPRGAASSRQRGYVFMAVSRCKFYIGDTVRHTNVFGAVHKRYEGLHTMHPTTQLTVNLFAVRRRTSQTLTW